MSQTQKISRREMLKLMSAAAAGAAMAGTVPAFAKPAATTAKQAAKGRLVIMSDADPSQNQPLIKAIEDANPGITVDWRNLTSERYVELFSASDLAGEQIDLMDMNGQDLRRYATAGKLVDLSDLKYLDRFQPVAVQTYNFGGKQWALPRGGIDGFTFLYNRKLLDKVGYKGEPATYDDLLKLKPELNKVGAAVFTHQGKNIYLWPVWQFWAFGQTSGNKPIEMTIKTLQGDMKWTDPMHVGARRSCTSLPRIRCSLTTCLAWTRTLKQPSSRARAHSGCGDRGKSPVGVRPRNLPTAARTRHRSLNYR